MSKLIEFGKMIALTFVFFVILFIVNVMLTSAISRSETREPEFTEGKEIYLNPGEEYELTYTGIREGRLLFWEWNIIDFNDDSIEFQIKDDEKRVYYFLSNENQTSEAGEIYFNEPGDYKLSWKNVDSEKNSTIVINELILWDSEGIEEPMIVIYLLIPILIITYIYYIRKNPGMKNKQIITNKKVKVVIVVIVSLILLNLVYNTMINSNFQPDKLDITLESDEQYRLKYPDLVEGLSVPIEWSIDGNNSITFWIENGNGEKFKIINNISNINEQYFWFTPLSSGDYTLVFENHGSDIIHLEIISNPNTKDNSYDILKLFLTIICAHLIYLNVNILWSKDCTAP